MDGVYFFLTLLPSERPKLYGVLALSSAKVLKYINTRITLYTLYNFTFGVELNMYEILYFEVELNKNCSVFF